MGEKYLKPKIRFKGFNDAWEQCKLGDLGTFKSNGVDKLSKPNEIPVNLLNYMDIYKRRELNNKMTSELMQVTAKSNQLIENNVLKGDVFFTPTSETADDIGHCLAIKETLENTVYSYHLMRYRPYENSFYLKYPNYAFDTSAVKNQMSLMAQGVQRFVLSKSQFENIEISYTNLEEQKKIAEFLDNLDSLITLHQCKCDKFINMKKALLEKMFPSNDKNIPEIRFKGFTDAWEQCKIGDVLKSVSIDIDLKPSEFGEYEVIQQGNDSIAGYSNKEPFRNFESIVLFGDHTLSLYKPKKPFLIASDGVKAYFLDNVEGNYFYNLLNINLPKNEGYKRYSSILKDQYFTLTYNKEEQQKIGQLFNDLDSLITLHQCKLEKLKNIKKALLEQMFC